MVHAHSRWIAEPLSINTTMVIPNIGIGLDHRSPRRIEPEKPLWHFYLTRWHWWYAYVSLWIDDAASLFSWFSIFLDFKIDFSLIIFNLITFIMTSYTFILTSYYGFCIHLSSIHSRTQGNKKSKDEHFFPVWSCCLQDDNYGCGAGDLSGISSAAGNQVHLLWASGDGVNSVTEEPHHHFCPCPHPTEAHWDML